MIDETSVPSPSLISLTPCVALPIDLIWATGSLIKTPTLGDYGINQANDVILSHQNKVIVIGSSESVLNPFQNSKGSKDIFLAIWY